MKSFPKLRSSRVLWDLGTNDYFFSRRLGALVIILGDLGSQLIVLGIKGALPKSKI